MAGLDPRAARLLAVVLALTALVGFGQGLAQALKAPRPEQVAAGVDPSRDPVPNASALAGPALDEARVRQIAREEASAALSGARKKVTPAAKTQDDSPSGEDAVHPASSEAGPAAAAAVVPAPATPAPVPPG